MQLPGRPVVFPFHLNRVYVISSLDEKSLEFLANLGQALKGEDDLICSIPVTFHNNAGVYVWNAFDLTCEMSSSGMKFILAIP